MTLFEGKKGVSYGLFVGDFVLYYGGTGMNVNERQPQFCINGIHQWSVLNGFKFSKAKTVCMHFCQPRRMQAEPEPPIDGDPMRVVKETKFLGLIFYAKPSYIPHIKYLKIRCLNVLDILMVLSTSDWGAGRDVLLAVYRTLVRS